LGHLPPAQLNKTIINEMCQNNEETIMANILPNTDGGLITADNSAVVFIDHQPQMIFGVANIERQQLVNNVVMLAKGDGIL
jgi:hypothetical protein